MAPLAERNDNLRPTLLVYGLFLLVGLGILAWLVDRGHLGPKLDDLERRKSVNYHPPAEADLPFPYDRSGRIAAYRLYDRAPDSTDAQPLFWLKGNLQIVRDDDWHDGRPRFQMTTLPRPDLEALMNAIAALAPGTTGDRYWLERRDREGRSETVTISARQFEDLLVTVLADRDWRPFLPPAVALEVEDAPAAAATTPWPLRRPGLAELEETGRLTIDEARIIDRLLGELRPDGFYPGARGPLRIRLRVLCDRP